MAEVKTWKLLFFFKVMNKKDEGEIWAAPISFYKLLLDNLGFIITVDAED